MSVQTTKIAETFGPISTGVPCVVNGMKTYSSDQVAVYVNGNEADPAVIGVDYTLLVAGDYSGVTVTPLAPLTARATSIVVARKTPLTSDFDVAPSGKLSEPRLVEQLDRALMREQETADTNARALRAPAGEAALASLPAAGSRAGKLLGFDLDGRPVPATATGFVPETLTEDLFAPTVYATEAEMRAGVSTTKLVSPRGASQSVAARLGVFSPLDYGAYFDGTVHTVAASLGVFTLAALAAYTRNGEQPYAWARQLVFDSELPFGNLFNIPVAAATGAGATLTFKASQTVNGAVAAGYIIRLNDIAGVVRGMLVSGTNIPVHTYVEFVNPATGHIWLSKAVAGAVANGAPLIFTHPELASVAAGMQVVGPWFAAGTTVLAVDAGLQTVTLSAAISSALVTNTLNSAGTPQPEPDLVTFFAPYTDAQVMGMSMDQLAVNAAVRAAHAAGGGCVRLPRGTGMIDWPVVLPLHDDMSEHAGVPILDMVGAGRNATLLKPSRDFGRGVPVLSSGDWTANYQNGRGVFSLGPSYYACRGRLADFSVGVIGAPQTFGLTPVWPGSAAPARMDGVLQGPRRNMERVGVSGFVNGVREAADHTTWANVASWGNFNGVRHEAGWPGGTVLMGDYAMRDCFFAGNGWAGVSVAPHAALGEVSMSGMYLSNPFAFFLEPGAGARLSEVALFDIVSQAGNAEWCGGGFIKDGTTLNGGSALRSIQALKFDGILMTSPTTNPPVQQSTAWTAYVDVNNIYGLAFTNVTDQTFVCVAGKPILNFNTAGVLGSVSKGILLSGPGMDNVVTSYEASQTELISGAGGSQNATMTFAQAWQYVLYECPGLWKARPYLVGGGVGALVKGALLEASQALSNASLAVRKAGVSANAQALTGVNMQAWTGTADYHYTVVGVQGTHLPCSVGAAQAVGTYLKVNTATPGIATPMAGLGDLNLAGAVSDANSGSNSLVYIRSMWPCAA